MQARSTLPEYLTTGMIPPEVVADLGLRIEAGVRSDGELNLSASHRPFLFSVHLPYVDEQGRLNVGALDDDRREESIAIVQRGIDVAKMLGVRRGVVHPLGIGRDDDVVLADWERTAEGLQRLADYGRIKGLDLVLENVCVYWDGVPDSVPAETADRSKALYLYGCSPVEWRDLCLAVDRENFRLCLDSTHTVTYAMLSDDPSEQVRRVHEYLDVGGDLIVHVHWSDNYLGGVRGRYGTHLHVGQGTVPRSVHERIKHLAAVKHLEHKGTAQQLRAELDFIAHL
ncbi:MAG: hypothetical protein CL878_08725 [Dehalococcoidia bacterium]|nr:hypothetical protein [Dehalococcoidia bacterium]